jgi:hypothetical protein
MGSSINYAKQIYKKSEIGLLESFIRRFHTTKKLSDALNLDSETKNKIEKIRKDAEVWHTKHTDEFIEEENLFRSKQKDFMDRQNKKLIADMNAEADILREFEKTFNSKALQ